MSLPNRELLYSSDWDPADVSTARALVDVGLIVIWSSLRTSLRQLMLFSTTVLIRLLGRAFLFHKWMSCCLTLIYLGFVCEAMDIALVAPVATCALPFLPRRYSLFWWSCWASVSCLCSVASHSPFAWLALYPLHMHLSLRALYLCRCSGDLRNNLDRLCYLLDYDGLTFGPVVHPRDWISNDSSVKRIPTKGDRNTLCATITCLFSSVVLLVLSDVIAALATMQCGLYMGRFLIASMSVRLSHYSSLKMTDALVLSTREGRLLKTSRSGYPFCRIYAVEVGSRSLSDVARNWNPYVNDCLKSVLYRPLCQYFHEPMARAKARLLVLLFVVATHGIARPSLLATIVIFHSLLAIEQACTKLLSVNEVSVHKRRSLEPPMRRRSLADGNVSKHLMSLGVLWILSAGCGNEYRISLAGH